jgi:hypothetical protein
VLHVRLDRLFAAPAAGLRSGVNARGAAWVHPLLRAAGSMTRVKDGVAEIRRSAELAREAELARQQALIEASRRRALAAAAGGGAAGTRGKLD